MSLSDITSKSDISELIARGVAGENVDGIVILSTAEELDDKLPEDAASVRVFWVDGMLAMLLPDGTIFVLTNPKSIDVTSPIVVLQQRATSEDAWKNVEDLEYLSMENGKLSASSQGSGEITVGLVSDPLIGYPISPLLPPTDYTRSPRLDFDFGSLEDGGVGGDPNIIITQLAPLIRVETDLPLRIRLSDTFEITAGNADSGERISQVTITLAGLPSGTRASEGSFTADGDGTVAFNFTGSFEDFERLSLFFPRDFSTDQRSDIASGDIEGTISAISNFSAIENTPGPVVDFTLQIAVEGDAEIYRPIDTVPDETDGPTPLVPVELLRPEASDMDGSETLTSLRLVIEGLPADADLVSLGLAVPAGAAAVLSTAADLSTMLVITMESASVGSIPDAYGALALSLPQDFSTTNRLDLASDTSRPITLTLTVLTDEETSPGLDSRNDGEETAVRDVIIDYEIDVDLSAPLIVVGDEDGDGFDGDGVTLNPDIFVQPTDIDGSEDATFVRINSNTLPTGTLFSTGNYDALGGVWQGSMAEAQALTLTFPGDFSGDVSLPL